MRIKNKQRADALLINIHNSQLDFIAANGNAPEEVVVSSHDLIDLKIAYEIYSLKDKYILGMKVIEGNLDAGDFVFKTY